MNAKMTITVPLDKINVKVAELIEQIANNMEEVQVSLTDISVCLHKEQDIMKQIDNLDKCRKELALLDANIEDCYSVLIGLVNYKTGLNNKEVDNAAKPTE